VTALDITHDPAHGMDTYALFDYLCAHPHPELRYIISNRRVARKATGWVAKKYTGSHPHNTHIHVAVGEGHDSQPLPPYDSTESWGLREWAGEEDDMTPEQDKLLKQMRVSDVARSYDVEIIKALVAGKTKEADELEDAKTDAVMAEKKKLGL
jgi:hypothetical protein